MKKEDLFRNLEINSYNFQQGTLVVQFSIDGRELERILRG